jgi:hypothetical protein
VGGASTPQLRMSFQDMLRRGLIVRVTPFGLGAYADQLNWRNMLFASNKDDVQEASPLDNPYTPTIGARRAESGRLAPCVVKR